MKKYLLLLVFFSLYWTSLEAQEYEPLIKEGSFWDFEFWHSPDGNDTPYCPDFTLRYQIANDTLINGNIYKKVKAFTLQGEPNSIFPEICIDPPYYYDANDFTFENRYLREDLENKTVYIWAQTKDVDGNLLPYQEMILYKFDVQVGDVIDNVYLGEPFSEYTGMGIGLEVSETVIEVGYDTNENRNFVQTTYGRYFEGLGNLEDVFRAFETALSHAMVMTCYGDAQNQNNCAPTLSTSNDQLQQIKIFPNPTSGKISFTNIEGSQFKLYSILGTEINIQFSNEHEEMNISHLPTGVYLLQIQNENGRSRIEKIIKN